MHASTVIFAPLALLAGLVAARPSDSNTPATGERCCNGGTNDTSDFCLSFGLNSFCCSGFDASIGTGCDDIPEFPTGRNIQNFVPSNTGCTVPGIRSRGTLPGFIGCA
ncbi:uncharacterized protein GLRG_11495 [Colletotrichum graminicola M1.001]|uniref:Hydrophobin n=1 Tax=Colletotrichum graminicola (strain M1.001 / M2 / FGSC 10212) TaxID=645133 RepID=E3QZR2_COLGM|nr:uncharacterized protein GLRG_11495 [Colletotrichum graminicola M1.001]EFQ36350.1 hypothetical protein GLRG_11495 [Colletotrichum graminicola M1.001]